MGVNILFPQIGVKIKRIKNHHLNRRVLFFERGLRSLVFFLSQGVIVNLFRGSLRHTHKKDHSIFFEFLDQKYKVQNLIRYTLQGINISHLGKRKIIFKMPFLGDMLVSWRV